MLSSGIGAAHASGRPTTIVTGDLGLLHDVGGLAALRGVYTPVRIVVINNDGGGIFGFLPQAAALEDDEFEALLGTPRGINAGKAASLFDLPHRSLTSLAELPAVLDPGTAYRGRSDRAKNTDLHNLLGAAVARGCPVKTKGTERLHHLDAPRASTMSLILPLTPSP